MATYNDTAKIHINGYSLSVSKVKELIDSLGPNDPSYDGSIKEMQKNILLEREIIGGIIQKIVDNQSNSLQIAFNEFNKASIILEEELQKSYRIVDFISIAKSVLITLHVLRIELDKCPNSFQRIESNVLESSSSSASLASLKDRKNSDDIFSYAKVLVLSVNTIREIALNQIQGDILKALDSFFQTANRFTGMLISRRMTDDANIINEDAVIITKISKELAYGPNDENIRRLIQATSKFGEHTRMILTKAKNIISDNPSSLGNDHSKRNEFSMSSTLNLDRITEKRGSPSTMSNERFVSLRNTVDSSNSFVRENLVVARRYASIAEQISGIISDEFLLKEREHYKEKKERAKDKVIDLMHVHRDSDTFIGKKSSTKKKLEEMISNTSVDLSKWSSMTAKDRLYFQLIPSEAEMANNFGIESDSQAQESRIVKIEATAELAGICIETFTKFMARALSGDTKSLALCVDDTIGAFGEFLKAINEKLKLDKNYNSLVEIRELDRAIVMVETHKFNMIPKKFDNQLEICEIDILKRRLIETIFRNCESIRVFLSQLMATTKAINFTKNIVKRHILEVSIISQVLVCTMQTLLDNVNMYRNYHLHSNGTESQLRKKEILNTISAELSQNKPSCVITTAGVKVASLERLIIMLTLPEQFDNNLTRIFVTTFPSFTNCERIVELVKQRYEYPIPGVKADYIDAVKMKIFKLLMHLFNISFSEFDETSILRIEKFAEEKMILDKCAVFVPTLKNKITRNVENRKRKDNFYQVPPEILLPEERISPMDYIQKISEDEISRQLMLIDKKILDSIQKREFLKRSWRTPGLEKHAQNLINIITRVKRISSWLATLLVSTADVEERTSLFSKFIGVGYKLKEMGNHNTLKGLVDGLTSASVHRMGELRKRITNERLKQLSELENTVENLNKSKKGSSISIPNMELYLSELNTIEDNNPDFIDGMINMAKFQQIYNIITDFESLREKIELKFPIVQPLFTNLLQLPAVGDDELIRLSLVVEPAGDKDDTKRRTMKAKKR